MAWARGAGGATTFEVGDTFFQHGNGGIGKPRINKPKGLQIEQRCRVVYIIEHVGCGMVDRRIARTGSSIRRGAGMNSTGFEAEGIFGIKINDFCMVFGDVSLIL